MHLHINDNLKSVNMILFREEQTQSESVNDLDLHTHTHTHTHTVSTGLEDRSFLCNAIFCLSFVEHLSMNQISKISANPRI